MVCLSGCGGSKNEEISEVGYQSKIGDTLDYVVYGIETVQKLDGVAPISSSLCTVPTDSSNVLLDFIIDVTNNGTTEFSPYHELSGKFVIDSVDYEITAYAETAGEVFNFNTIMPKTTSYVHIFTEIKKELISDEIELQLTYNSKTQKMSLNTKDLQPIIATLELGSTISNDDKTIDIQVNKAYTTKKLTTPVAGKYFSNYYQVDDSSSTYAVLEMNLTNKTTIDIEVDKTLSVSVLADNTYKYTGFIVGLEDSQTDFDIYCYVTPNKTTTIYALIEVPDSMLEKTISFRLNAFEKPYYIKLQ